MKTTVLKQLQIALPPLDYQSAFAERITDIQAMIAQQDRMAEASEDLMASLIVRTFDVRL